MATRTARANPLASRSVTPDLTLRDWLDDWLIACRRRGIRDQTVHSYRSMIELYIPEALRNTPLDAIRGRDLNLLYDHLLTHGRRDGSGGLSARTVRYVHTILKRAFADALRAERMTSNPALSADPPSQRAARAPVFPVWSASELQQFLISSQDDPNYAAFHLAASTGLRRSEVLGLRWRDVNLDLQQLQVLQTVILVGSDVRIGIPKTDRSRRLVAIDEKTVSVLQAHRERAGARFRNGDGSFPDTLIFRNHAGGPIHPTLFSHYFQKRVEASGLRRIRFHDLRHTHATLALQAGVHPKVISERLGHSSITITLEIYSHALPSMQREAAEAIASLLTDATN